MTKKAIEKGKVYFIGAGPGDPELITVRGAKIIEAADLIVYAGSLVPRSLLSMAKEGVEIHDSSSLSLEETHALLRKGVREDQIVARVHTGDPALYGAIQEQIQMLQNEKMQYEVVPGVTVAFAGPKSRTRSATSATSISGTRARPARIASVNFCVSRPCRRKSAGE